MTKFIAWFSFIVLVIGITWAGLVYGLEFKTDTENWYQDKIQQDKDNTENTENDETTIPDVTAKINATGTMFLIN